MAIYEEGYMITMETEGGSNIYLSRVNMVRDTFSLEWAGNIGKALKFPISSDMEKVKIYYDLVKYLAEDGRVSCVVYRVMVDEVTFGEADKRVDVEEDVPEIETEGKSDKYIRSLRKLLSAMKLILMNEENGKRRSINDVAQAVGYKDSSGLGNVMKANIGMSPLEYVEQSSENKARLIDTLESVLR